jgi:hypothetical protein
VGVSATPTHTATTSASTVAADAWARVPKAARAHTFAGAQAFAEFYVGQVNVAWTEARADLLEGYAGTGCRTCANFGETAAQLGRSGQRYERAPFVIRSGTWLPESTLDIAVVDLVLTQRATRIVGPGGYPVDSVAAEAAVSRSRLRWVASSWRIESMQIVAPR